MKNYSFIHYTLLSFITFGCFAAFAKQGYGFWIISGGCLIFTLSFFIEMGITLSKKDNPANKLLLSLECLALAIVAFLLFCKAFIVLFLGIDKLYLSAILILGVIYAFRIYQLRAKYPDRNPKSIITRGLFYLALLAFILADGYQKLTYSFFLSLTIAGLACSAILFLYIGYERLKGPSQKVKAEEYLPVETNKSYWLLLGYILLSSYSFMVHVGFADEVYFKRLPRDYVKFFYEAESGREKPVNGKYIFETLKEGHRRFLDNYSRKNK